MKRNRKERVYINNNRNKKKDLKKVKQIQGKKSEKKKIFNKERKINTYKKKQ